MKKIYLGVNGVAKKVKKAYIGVKEEGTSYARKIKKAYLGVDNIARPVMTSEVTYWGETTPLSWGRPGHMSASTEDYAFFAGGEYAGNDCETYNKSLTRTIIDGLSFYSEFGGAASLDNTVIFAGGFDITNYLPVSNVERYDNSLVKTVLPDSLSHERGHIAGLNIGDYAVFAGGAIALSTSYNITYNNIDCYDKYGTHTVYELPSTAFGMSAASAGNTGLFYGCSNIVFALDTSMTIKTTDDKSEGTEGVRSKLFGAGVSLENYAVFAGGQTGSYITNSPPGALNLVKVYDSSLTKVSQLSLLSPSTQLAGAGLGDFALFAGGMSDESALNITNCFDTSLTLKDVGNLKNDRRLLKAAVVGNYALFAGGCSKESMNNAVSSTEVYVF